jgi:hypothetical protein
MQIRNVIHTHRLVTVCARKLPALFFPINIGDNFAAYISLLIPIFTTAQNFYAVMKIGQCDFFSSISELLKNKNSLLL